VAHPRTRGKKSKHYCRLPGGNEKVAPERDGKKDSLRPVKEDTLKGYTLPNKRSSWEKKKGISQITQTAGKRERTEETAHFNVTPGEIRLASHLAATGE